MLREFVDVVGASGVAYRFMRLRDGRPLSPMGGNYLYVRLEDDRYRVICAGEVSNLLRDAQGRWAEATQMHGELTLYTRLNISERVRQLELTDIAEACQPPMNPRQAPNSDATGATPQGATGVTIRKISG